MSRVDSSYNTYNIGDIVLVHTYQAVIIDIRDTQGEECLEYLCKYEGRHYPPEWKPASAISHIFDLGVRSTRKRRNAQEQKSNRSVAASSKLPHPSNVKGIYYVTKVIILFPSFILSTFCRAASGFASQIPNSSTSEILVEDSLNSSQKRQFHDKSVPVKKESDKIKVDGTILEKYKRKLTEMYLDHYDTQKRQKVDIYASSTKVEHTVHDSVESNTPSLGGVASNLSSSSNSPILAEASSDLLEPSLSAFYVPYLLSNMPPVAHRFHSPGSVATELSWHDSGCNKYDINAFRNKSCYLRQMYSSISGITKSACTDFVGGKAHVDMKSIVLPGPTNSSLGVPISVPLHVAANLVFSSWFSKDDTWNFVTMCILETLLRDNTLLSFPGVKLPPPEELLASKNEEDLMEYTKLLPWTSNMTPLEMSTAGNVAISKAALRHPVVGKLFAAQISTLRLANFINESTSVLEPSTFSTIKASIPSTILLLATDKLKATLYHLPKFISPISSFYKNNITSSFYHASLTHSSAPNSRRPKYAEESTKVNIAIKDGLLNDMFSFYHSSENYIADLIQVAALYSPFSRINRVCQNSVIEEQDKISVPYLVVEEVEKVNPGFSSSFSQRGEINADQTHNQDGFYKYNSVSVQDLDTAVNFSLSAPTSSASIPLDINLDHLNPFFREAYSDSALLNPWFYSASCVLACARSWSGYGGDSSPTLEEEDRGSPLYYWGKQYSTFIQKLTTSTLLNVSTSAAFLGGESGGFVAYLLHRLFLEEIVYAFLLLRFINYFMTKDSFSFFKKGYDFTQFDSVHSNLGEDIGEDHILGIGRKKKHSFMSTSRKNLLMSFINRIVTSIGKFPIDHETPEGNVNWTDFISQSESDWRFLDKMASSDVITNQAYTSSGDNSSDPKFTSDGEIYEKYCEVHKFHLWFLRYLWQTMETDFDYAAFPTAHLESNDTNGCKKSQYFIQKSAHANAIRRFRDTVSSLLDSAILHSLLSYRGVASPIGSSAVGGNEYGLASKSLANESILKVLQQSAQEFESDLLHSFRSDVMVLLSETVLPSIYFYGRMWKEFFQARLDLLAKFEYK